MAETHKVLDTLGVPPIPGDVITGPTKDKILERLAKLFDPHAGRSRASRFPGAQPVSFMRQHMTNLLRENYYVGLKVDGVRVLVFATLDPVEGKPKLYFIDRKNSVWRVPVPLMRDIKTSPFHPDDPYYDQHKRLPSQPVPQGPRRFSYDTVMDGEFMYEYHRRTGEKHRVLMLFDLMFFNARDYRQKNFDKRNGAMREYVLVPHNRHLDKLPPDEQRKWRERQPFQITGKKLFTPYHIKDAFEHPSNLSMKMDGLIFTRASAPYTTGTNEAMLKWKPVEENSVDFEVRPLSENPDEHIFELYVTQMARKKIFISVLTLRPEDQSTWSAEKLKTGTILECWYDLKEPDPDRRWRPMRVREDKDTSNHISTYTNVMKSMIESISRDCLLENQDRIRDNWKARDEQRDMPWDEPIIEADGDITITLDEVLGGLGARGSLAFMGPPRPETLPPPLQTLDDRFPESRGLRPVGYLTPPYNASDVPEAPVYALDERLEPSYGDIRGPWHAGSIDVELFGGDNHGHYAGWTLLPPYGAGPRPPGGPDGLPPPPPMGYAPLSAAAAAAAYRLPHAELGAPGGAPGGGLAGGPEGAEATDYIPGSPQGMPAAAGPMPHAEEETGYPHAAPDYD